MGAEGGRSGGGGAIKAERVCHLRVYVRVRVLRRESSTRGWVGGLPTRWGAGEGGGFKKLREATPNSWRNAFDVVRVGQLSGYSQGLLLPLAD